MSLSVVGAGLLLALCAPALMQDPEPTVPVRIFEENWTIVHQPRCCSDCTFVSRGFKCKVKSCLSNCPWARSSANRIPSLETFAAVGILASHLWTKYNNAAVM